MSPSVSPSRVATLTFGPFGCFFLVPLPPELSAHECLTIAVPAMSTAPAAQPATKEKSSGFLDFKPSTFFLIQPRGPHSPPLAFPSGLYAILSKQDQKHANKQTRTHEISRTTLPRRARSTLPMLFSPH